MNRRQTKSLGALTITAALLAGCSTPQSNLGTEIPLERYAYSSSVTVQANDTRESIAAQTGGVVTEWRPEVGFAIIGFQNEPLGLLGATTASNMNAVQAPEVNGAGLSVWGSGLSAWGSGYSAWASGLSAWGSGTAGRPTTFSENLNAWKLIKLDTAWARAPKLGGGIKIAVIDSGIDLGHPAFQGRLAPSSEWNDYVNGGTPQEEGARGQVGYGHGTAVASIALQVAPNAIILPIRVLDASGKGDTDKVASAVGWATDRGAQVINLSLGSLSAADPLQRMINYALSKGVIVVTSTGNTNDERVTFPASTARNSNQIVGVSSVQSSGQRSGFSTYGSSVEIYATGDQIQAAAPGNSRMAWSGTSMAAPVVTGLIALGLGQGPRDLTNYALQIGNTADQNLFNQNNQSGPASSRNSMGILNADKFLEQTVQQ